MHDSKVTVTGFGTSWTLAYQDQRVKFSGTKDAAVRFANAIAPTLARNASNAISQERAGFYLTRQEG